MRFTLGSVHRRAFHNSRRPWDVARYTTLRAKRAHNVIEIVAGVDRDTLRFGHALAAGVPRLILKLEDRAHWSVRDDLPRLEVESAIEFVVAPDARAPSAERFSDVKKVGAFANVAMILVVALRVLLVDAWFALPLDLDIETTAVQ